MREDGVKCVAGLILSSYFLAKLRILKWLDIIYTTILIFTCMTQFVGLEIKAGGFGFRGSVKLILTILYKY